MKFIKVILALVVFIPSIASASVSIDSFLGEWQDHYNFRVNFNLRENFGSCAAGASEILNRNYERASFRVTKEAGNTIVISYMTEFHERNRPGCMLSDPCQSRSFYSLPLFRADTPGFDISPSIRLQYTAEGELLHEGARVGTFTDSQLEFAFTTSRQLKTEFVMTLGADEGAAPEFRIHSHWISGRNELIHQIQKVAAENWQESSGPYGSCQLSTYYP